MVATKLCGVCGKEEMVDVCEICGIPLCAKHLKRIPLEEKTPTAEGIAGVFISPVRFGTKVRKVCRKCMMESEFYEGEYF